MPFRTPRFRQDLLLCAALAAVAGMLGLATNRLRPAPLPIRYVDKEARLLAVVSTLQSDVVPAGEIRQVLPEEFAELLAGAGVTVLDARAEVFYQLGHIPGALPLPREDFRVFYAEHRAKLEADKARPLVVYCQSGDCEDSELVARALGQLGFRNVRVLAGGWEAWQARPAR